jgi:predicted house-cleaning noncanonical NTP pyrophosphatase (MazG superfamily)
MFRFPRKLVRDRIPSIIASRGGRAVVKVLHGDKLRKAMLDKIVEEAKELRKAESTSERIEELADLAEILAAFMCSVGVTGKHVEAIREEKYKGRGAYTTGTMLMFSSGGSK